MRTRALLLFIGIGFFPAALALAQTATSTNYQNSDSSVLPLIVKTQSSNYAIDGSVEPIVGNSESASFKVEIGAQNPSGTTPVLPPSYGGGGGGSGLLLAPTSSLLEPPPTIDPRNWTYKTTALVQGSRGVAGASILFNGSDVGVTYPNEERWMKIIPLGLGDNVMRVQAKIEDRFSIIIIGVVHRRLIGDVNDNRVVDDIDLSLFTRHWKRFDNQSDFNEDGIIDDIDLSLLASHWGRRY